ncbi:MAG: hypothetical protein LBS55_05310 [Prevotellaceae bacterium]|jgi:hypothetical protein|nr:hypothetical protein [Prevotellaceae bacterium]
MSNQFDCTELGDVVREEQSGNDSNELVMVGNDLVFMPKKQADRVAESGQGVKAGQAAKNPYWATEAVINYLKTISL